VVAKWGAGHTGNFLSGEMVLKVRNCAAFFHKIHIDHLMNSKIRSYLWAEPVVVP